MKTPLVRINIALMPSPAVAMRAKAVSKKIAKKQRLFTLDRAHRPHVTLYMAYFPRRSLARLVQRLRGTEWNIKSLALTPISLAQKQDGYVEVRYRSTPEIKAFQKKIVALANPLRKGTSPQSHRRLSLAERRSLKRYGYASIGKNYRPHLTLTRLAHPQRLPRLAVKDFSFRAVSFGVYVAGEHGTCKKLRESFSLDI